MKKSGLLRRKGETGINIKEKPQGEKEKIYRGERTLINVGMPVKNEGAAVATLQRERCWGSANRESELIFGLLHQLV